jgi:hypothetical protein
VQCALCDCVLCGIFTFFQLFFGPFLSGLGWCFLLFLLLFVTSSLFFVHSSTTILLYHTITLSHYTISHYHTITLSIWSLPVNHWARLVWTGLDWTCCVVFPSCPYTLHFAQLILVWLCWKTSPTPQPWIVDKFSRMMWNRIYHAYETIMQLC